MSLKNLFQPKHKHPNPEKRKKAVAKITDQEQLAQIVKEDKEIGVRLAALERISDQALLADIGIHVTRYDIAKAAIQKMDDVEAVKSLLDSANNAGIRIAALHRLTGLQIKKEALARIIKETTLKAKNEGLRSAAIDYLEDPAVLREVALNDTYIINKVNAAVKLKDEEHLVVLLIDESEKTGDRLNMSTCKTILEHISEENILTRIAMKNPVFELRKIAEEKVSSQTLQQEIAMSKRERYANYDRSKVMKIDNPYHALDVAIHAEKRDLRTQAITNIYFKYKAGKMTLTVKWMPSDIRSKLEEIGRNDEDKVVSGEASSALDRLDGKY